MPRTLRPRLRTMLERANPNVATFVELSVPDTGKILRRAEDQFLQSPDPLVSMTPAVSAQASPAGALTLASVSQTLISQYVPNGSYFYLPQEQGSGKFHGTVGWTLDAGFPGAILRGVTVKLRWISPLTPDVALQIYKVHRSAGVIRRQQGTSTIETFAVQYSFAPLLSEPVVRRFRDIGVILSDVDVAFDLTPYHLAIDPISAPPPGPNESGDLPEYFFEIQPLMQPTGNFVGWARDTSSSRVLANIGTVRDVGWQRANPDDPASLWVRTNHDTQSLAIKIDVEQYSATSQEVYALTLPATPSADSTGRVVFRHGEPSGTSAALELSTAGSSGPWTPVADGDEVTVRQATYHARLTMNASADQRRAPVVSAIGVEFRGTRDLSAEATLEPMTQGVSIPFCQASVGEGRVSVVRAGRRDYRDLGGETASEGPDTQLEVDAFLGSRHPAVTRADWFHTTRAQVSTRQPSGTSEVFTLLSIAKTLKRKIPARVESISAVHTVVAASTTQVQVSPNLSGASAGGNEYDGKGYYIRVRKSSQPGVETGQTFTIDGNTGVNKLDFPANADPVLSHELPGTFAVGDEIEVHSARYAQPALQWVDQDPADIWWELLTLHLGVPENRIGLADVGGTGRAGLPPTVADRAPGDSATQALLKVTLKITDAEDGDALIDQLSFIMGGATVEIAGQLVFRQIYALKDAAGRVTVAPDAPVKTFGVRDFSDLDTPTGREQRITVCACDYGVDTTSAAALPTATTNFVDVDALDAYELQDVEGLGTDQVPDEIARWCYNSTDLGKFLATQLAQQVVGACSTGVRLWPFTTVDAHPELTVGDTVVVITDQYTDFDPARGIAVKGMMAYPLVLVSTAAGGRRFTGFLQGLAGVVGVDVRGGDGTLQDNNPTPAGTTSSPLAIIDIVSFDEDEVILALSGALGIGDPGPLEYHWRTDMGAWSAYGTSHPDQTITRELKATQVFQLQTRQSDGQESAVFSFPVTGKFPQVDPATGLVDGLDASGLVTHPVPLPLAVANIPAIDPTDGKVKPDVQFHGTVHYPPRATDVNGMILDSGTKDNRSRLLNTGFQYGVDTAVGVVETAGEKFVNGTALDGSRNVDFGSAGVVNRLAANVLRIAGGASMQSVVQQLTDSGHAGSGMQDSRAALLNGMFRYGTDSSNGVVDGTGSPITGGKRGFATIDSSNRVYRANGFDDGYYAVASTNSAGTALHGSVVDSRAALVNAMFRAGVDTLSSVLNDGTWRKVAASQVDTSGIITNAGTAPTVTGISAYNADFPGDGGGGFDVSWNGNNLPPGTTYDIVGTITAGNTSGTTAFSATGVTSSPVHFSHPLGPSAPSCKMTITAKFSGVTVCVGVFGDSAIAF